MKHANLGRGRSAAYFVLGVVACHRLLKFTLYFFMLLVPLAPFFNERCMLCRTNILLGTLVIKR